MQQVLPRCSEIVAWPDHGFTTSQLELLPVKVNSVLQILPVKISKRNSQIKIGLGFGFVSFFFVNADDGNTTCSSFLSCRSYGSIAKMCASFHTHSFLFWSPAHGVLNSVECSLFNNLNREANSNCFPFFCSHSRCLR
jgi:hypothetical protein